MMAADIGELDQKTLEKIFQLVHRLTGISLGDSKKTLVQGRLRPRMRALQLSRFEDYLVYLDSHENEVQEFINLMTTNETSFFRTQRVWEYFVNDYLPNWSRGNPQGTLKIWSGASSSGEEVYTIGICCEEHRLKTPGFNYQIMGSDISTDVLAIAEKGIYSGRSIENFKKLNQKLFEKYLLPVSEGFRLRDDVKSKIRFFSHNLFSAPPQSAGFDIVFLRNVLIYFETQDQEKVLSNIGRSLVGNGILIIGESESLGGMNTPFKYKQPLVYTNGEG